MPTRRGWAVLAGVVTLAAAARILGIFELFVLATGAAALVVVGAVTVLVRRIDLDAGRSVRPSRIHVGAESRVELVVANRARRPSPVVVVRDTFMATSPLTDRSGAGTGRRQARFLLAPLGAGHQDRAVYRLPAEHRGIFTVGPLEAEVGDAFGLWSRVVTIAPSIELTVYPAVEPLASTAHAIGDDPTSGAPRTATVGPSGEDLYGLRPYEVGDDLRRVHWPSTARTGELVVRQLELPWQGRATVLLDVRAPVHTADTLEMAVSAAASVLTASWAGDGLVRLATTDGTDSGFAAGHAHVEAVMEHLAVVAPGRADGLEAVVGGLHRAGTGGGLTVVTTARARAGDLDLIAGLRSRFAALAIVVVDDPAARRPPAAPTTRSPGVTVLRVSSDTGLAPAWNHVYGARPARRAVGR